MGYRPIEDCGIIGNLHTVALVSKEGTIDFMCFPRFDSPSIFAALLDPIKGGRFSLSPAGQESRLKQIYMPDSAVLITRFLSEQGVAEVSDFMPIIEQGGVGCLVRRAKTVRGTIRFRMVCQPCFDYARASHRLEINGGEALFISKGPDQTRLRLRSDVPLRNEEGAAVAEFELQSGDCAAFILEDASGDSSASAAPDFVSQAFKRTLNFWQSWTQQSQYRGRWREMVERSAITLKLLTAARYGSIVAAPTFGLPEEIGGVRNWDYRYSWIRDASFTLYALMRLGYVCEAKAFMRWIEDRCRELEPGNPLQVMYAVDGAHELPETHLDHLAGYKNSRPVRIGNGAHKQLQLDIYGELMDSVYIYNKHEPISYDFWTYLVKLIDWVGDNWQRPDEGIWEVRHGPHEFLYSRVLCWVAVDRGLRLAERRSFPAPRSRWTELRDKIYFDIYNNFWDPELRTFVQHKGSKTVDASALLLPMVKFIAPNDPRWISTLKVINDGLVEDALVFRYCVMKGFEDGLPGKEGSFSMCSFWNVECLARTGDLKQARFDFEKTLSYANHLGLFSEEIGLQGEQLGNFPQALTHLALISAAWYLDQHLPAGA